MTRRRKVLRIVLIAAGCLIVLVGLFIAFMVWAYSDEDTLCWASFKTPEAANDAASLGSDLGYDTSIDEQKKDTHVTFESGETGDDAAEFRSDFLRILDAEGGILVDDGRKPDNPASLSADEARARGKTGCGEFGLLGRTGSP